MKKTGLTRISGIVFFKQKYISNPTVTAADAVIVAAQNMDDALKTNMNRHLSDESLTALSNLQKIFTHAVATKNPPKIRHNIRPT